MAIKEALIKGLAVLNLMEGVIHVATSLISFYGMYDTGIWDWRIATSPTADILLGIVSLVTGFVLGGWKEKVHDI